MKIKESYLLQHIGEKWVVMDTDPKSVNYNKIIALNPTGKFLWEKLGTGMEESALVTALRETFDVDAVTAQKDLDDFIRQLRALGCLSD